MTAHAFPSLETFRSIELLIDHCVELVIAGEATVDECLAAYPEQRAALEPVLSAAADLAAAPRPQLQPDPTRRAAFMATLRETPQQQPRFRMPSLPTFGSLSLGGLALRAAPAMAVAILAIVIVFAQGGSTASASTLTVFSGQVEQQGGSRWQPLADGAKLPQGVSIRTAHGGRALLTFPDGSTATMDGATQVSLVRITVDETTRHIELRHETGRLWNDVVTITGSSGASYTIRTPHATIEAHGTVFETIVDMDTSVASVEGQVRVFAATAADSPRAAGVDLAPGLTVRANAERVDTPREAASSGSISVRAPVAAALTSEDGASTGLLPSGVVFRQLPGVSTTIPTEEAEQRLQVGDLPPGIYMLMLRRYAEGEGSVVIETPAGTRIIDIPADVQSARVSITVDRDGTSVRLLTTEGNGEPVQNVAELAPVRIVDTPRSRSAIGLTIVPRRTEMNVNTPPGQQVTPTRTPTRTPEPRPTDTPTAAPTRPTPTPEPTTAASSTASTVRDALREALQSSDDVPLGRVLSSLLTGDERQDEERLGVLADALESESRARDRINQLIESGNVPGLSRDLPDAIDRVERGGNRNLGERLRENLSHSLGLGILNAIDEAVDDTLVDTEELAPLVTSGFDSVLR